MRDRDLRGFGPVGTNGPKAPCPLAVMDGIAKIWDGRECYGYAKEMREARAKVAELVAADREYEQARVDLDRATASHPGDVSEKTWQRVADRFEAAVVRRAAALAKFGVA